MAAPSPVLYALHHTIEPQGFENLCVDLLHREGYARIIPGGRSRDHGRDAEVRFYTYTKKGNPQTAFQFSMEVKWEQKLRKDIAKITAFSDTVERIIFVSSRPITNEKQDKLRDEFRESHQIALEIYDEGWFRIRLEEEHHDLADKHLGVKPKETPGFHANLVKLQGLTDENQKEILRYTSPETLRATLTAQTRNDPKNATAWKCLADVCYFMRDYDAALLNISKALKISDDKTQKWNLAALKAIVIAEQGITSGSRILLNKARRMQFSIMSVLGRSIDYYNLGNIIAALGDSEAAEALYRRSLEIDPAYPQAWKNLGSLLLKRGYYAEGMTCLDRALKIRPDLLEALCTKANVLIMSGENFPEALELIEKAFLLDPDLETKWPHAHYWHARALCAEGRFTEALEVVEDRLERKLDCPYLSQLATGILAKLWRSDPSYIPKAEEYFSQRIDPFERDYHALVEIMDLLSASDREDEAWSFFDEFLGVKQLSARLIASRCALTITDLTNSFVSIAYYKRYRGVSKLVDYRHILGDRGLCPHDEVPEILFHFLMPAYFKLASYLESSISENNFEEEFTVILSTYRLISGIFAAFGGSMLSSEIPIKVDEQSELIAAAIFIGFDFPLMEVSRLVGYLSGVLKREIPSGYVESISDQATEIHAGWLTVFLTAVGDDWKVEAWKK